MFASSRTLSPNSAVAEFRDELVLEVWGERTPPVSRWVGETILCVRDGLELKPGIVEAIRNMKWRFFVAEKGLSYLTCDNPVFFFPEIGMGNPGSEISFPVSSDVTLWLSWTVDRKEGYYPVPQSVLKEMNRRVVSNATRYVFSLVDETWVCPFAFKGKWQTQGLVRSLVI